MSRDGHTLSWKATGVLATEHLSPKKDRNTGPHICVCAGVPITKLCFSPVCKEVTSCQLFYSNFLRAFVLRDWKGCQTKVLGWTQIRDGAVQG